MILHLADLHFEKKWFKWAAARAARLADKEGGFALVIAGDLLHAGGDIKSQAKWVTGWLNDLTVRTIVCTGNHDVDWGDWGDLFAGVSNHLVTIDRDTSIAGQSVHVRTFADHRPPPACDFVVCHEPPARGTSHFDILRRSLLLRRITPYLVLSGHIHSPALWHDVVSHTHIIIPGATPGASTPNHVAIDQFSGTAELYIKERLTDKVLLD